MLRVVLESTRSIPRLDLEGAMQSITTMSYRDIITIEPDKRGGKPCVRRMQITVYDVLGWLLVCPMPRF